VEFNWKPADFNFVEEIKFTGGEPMLHPNFIKFLDVIIEGNNESHIVLDIFTNTSWTPKEKVLSRLRKFKHVKIWLSIDGVGPTQDYVRNGSTWDKVNESADTWCCMERDLPDTFSIVLTPTLNMYNVIHFMRVVEWWTQLRNRHNLPFTKMQGAGDIVISIVHFPESLNIKNLPNKEYYIKKYHDYLDNLDKLLPEYRLFEKIANRIILLLMQTKDDAVDITEFAEFTRDLDTLRSQDFKSVNPELYELIKDVFDITNGRLND
jgi:MoaA/NifB/PqqE/SkfB family radical SAM enzyme